MTTLILPGIGNSGPEHWQSHWERRDPTCRRVLQAEGDAPRCCDWVRTLETAVGSAPGRVLLVAHSSACALVAHWAREYADAWGSTSVNIGPAGHINAASGLGEWPAGYSLLAGLQGA